MKVDGRCHCGAITYEATVDPESVAVCHCTDCQMLTGSVYRAAVRAPRDRFRLLSGEPRTYVKTADSGARRVHAFCPTCGTPVYSTALVEPTAYSLRLGCLRQRLELAPRRQQWCGSALPWTMDLRDLPRS